MPSSSNPLNLLSAALLGFMGVPCTFLGVVGVLADSGPMRPVWGMLTVGGLGMIWGAVQAVVAWRRAEARERGHEAALYAVARSSTVAGLAGGAAQPAIADAGAPEGSAVGTADAGTLPAPAVRTADQAASTAAPVAPPPAAPAALPDAEVLAHWRYGEDEWSEYTRRELHFRKGEALRVGLAVLLFGMLLLAYQEDASYAAAIGVSAFVGGAIYLGRRLQAGAAHAANTATRGGEVIISPRAVMVNGRYHVLQDDRFHFAGVRLLDEENPPVLEFSVTWGTRSGPADEQVYVPVPRGREEEARALAASFPRTAGNRG